MNSTDPSKLYGEFRAIVVSIDDPKSFMRAQIRLLTGWSDIKENDLPWAEYKLPVGFRANAGSFTPVEVGDVVWVDFLNGDSRYPRITGSVHQVNEGALVMPKELYAPEYEHQRSDKQPAVTAVEEKAVYQYGAHLIEYEKDGSLRITNTNSGVSIEITKDGDYVVYATKAFIATTDEYSLEAKSIVFDVKGGDITIETDGAYSVKADQVVIESSQPMQFKSSKYEFE